MSDEEVIKRRLLIDGDGTGDDRRLNVILRLITKWAKSTDESQAENQLMYDRILCQLSQCEFSVKRSRLVEKITAKQHEKYKQLHAQIENQIASTKEEIEKNKENLSQAKIWKENKIQYDLIAQSIETQPVRKETNAKLSTLRDELEKLSEEKDRLEEKLDTRKKQFQVLATSANNLRALMEEIDSMKESSSTEQGCSMSASADVPEPMCE